MKAGHIVNAILTAASENIDISDVEDVLHSDISEQEKTSFFIQYILSQRALLLNFAKTLVIAVLIFIIGRKIVKVLLKMLNKGMARKEVELSLQKFIMSLTKTALNILLIFIVAGILGVGTSSIVAMVGSAGLAVGLALQGSLSNLAGGVLILLLKPFKVGDYIVTSGGEGTVCEIDIFYTRLNTVDNKVIVIPNGTISNSNVTNTSQQAERMLILEFMVSYDTDTAKIRELILSMMNRDERILKDKDRCVVIDKLNPLRVKMQAKAWVKTEDYWDVRYHLLEEIKETFSKEGISF